jgi:predicted acetyltransferase
MGIDANDRLDVRFVREDELDNWGRAGAQGFLMPYRPDDSDWRKGMYEPGRLVGAFDGERCVGTFRSIPFELTVPGGATLSADGIASVAVLATHRRRGLLSRMMELGLDAARSRGDVVSILYPAEYAIYGRYGFGPALRGGGYRIGVAASGGLRPGVGAGGGGRIELATMEEVRKVGPELHDRYRVTQPGAISRSSRFWQVYTGEVVRPGTEFKERFVALYRDAEGRATGLLAYDVEGEWVDGAPDSTLNVHDHFATTREAAEALWRYAFSVDWVRKVAVHDIAPDDPLPLLLNNPRAARPSGEGDAVWLRVLDVPAAFGARTYRVPGRTVLEVADTAPGGYAAGRWAVRAGADGSGRATPTDEPADLAIDAGVLGSLYLGAASVVQLAAAGLVRELRSGAAPEADLLLRSAVAPWCPDYF